MSELVVDIVSALDGFGTTREFVEAVTLLLDANEAHICASCIWELANQLLRGAMESVNLSGCEQERREAIGMEVVNAAEWVLFVLSADKVGIDKDIAHPARKWESAVRTDFGSQGTVLGPNCKVDRWIECGDSRNALWAELGANDESEVASCREATKCNAIGIIDLWLGEYVIDNFLGIMACCRERVFGSLAIVSIDKDAVGPELVQDVGGIRVVVTKLGQDKARAVPGDVEAGTPSEDGDVSLER